MCADTHSSESWRRLLSCCLLLAAALPALSSPTIQAGPQPPIPFNPPPFLADVKPPVSEIYMPANMYVLSSLARTPMPVGVAYMFHAAGQNGSCWFFEPEKDVMTSMLLDNGFHVVALSSLGFKWNHPLEAQRSLHTIEEITRAKRWEGLPRIGVGLSAGSEFLVQVQNMDLPLHSKEESFFKALILAVGTAFGESRHQFSVLVCKASFLSANNTRATVQETQQSCPRLCF
eukprot:m.394524 g.394524  ORF g.394524 m.394524 type:complete len:231 (+) comp56377_c0_seq5:91-783(+)